jgi:hypothetical protein
MFEKILRFLFLSAPPSLLFIYFLSLFLLPFFFLFFHFTTQVKKIALSSDQVERAITLFLEHERSQAVNRACAKFFAHKEKHALEKELEKIELLKKEKEEIEKLMSKETFFGNLPLEERLFFIKGKENRLHFVEISQISKMGVLETFEGLTHPVEVDLADLKEIVSKIEGNHSAFPQCLIADFQISRVKKEGGNEVYFCNLKLLKREFS